MLLKISCHHTVIGRACGGKSSEVVPHLILFFWGDCVIVTTKSLPRGRRGKSDTSVRSDTCLTKSSDTCPMVSNKVVGHMSDGV